MIEYFRGRGRAVRIGWAAALLALLPVVADFHFENTVRENGEITGYSYLSVSAIVAALCGAVYAFRRFSAARYDGALTGAVKAALVAVVLVSLVQGVRGSGVVPAQTECRASYSLHLCRPADTAHG
ncbi:hypothetical protein [Kitasatospora sp. NPDC005751]|uniref:hypothetical protein n=1 Tax=unclassified Kitasatospora TaxID=2633591 RepID=UPI0033D41297